MSKLMDSINQLYGNQHRAFDNVPNVMGTQASNTDESLSIKANGYHPVKAVEKDSKRFSYDNLGYPQDAINGAKQDIKDIKHSKTAQTSDDFKAEINFDKKQIKQDHQIPANKLVLISRLNDGEITRLAKPFDIEMIYHNTHYSMPEIVKRHPNVLAYTIHDAKLDAKQDLN